MRNLYSVTTNQEAIRRLFGDIRDATGNLPSMLGVYSDFSGWMNCSINRRGSWRRI
jgi:hypothetical protein